MRRLDDERLEQLRGHLSDEFDVMRLLGEGSTSRVYLARERALDRLVAIKVLERRGPEAATARRRFEREARAAASLCEHPDVVGVYRFGLLPEETPFLVMQFVDGRTVEDRVRAEGRLPLDDVNTILVAVASALAEAHRHGIVHRDVRPNNVMWDPDAGRAYLSDFGIAAIVGVAGWEVTRLTATHEMVGDPHYISPEQFDDQDPGPASDVYAVGVLGYVLLTGEGPFRAETTRDWIKAQRSQAPRELQSLRGETPQGIAALLRSCLERDPRHRPRAADIVRILSSHGDGSSERAGVNTLSLAELAHRRVFRAAAVAAGVGIGLVGLADFVVDNYDLPPDVRDVTVASIAAAFLATLVGTWFHGEIGRQRYSRTEWLWYGAIGAVFAIVVFFILS